MGREYNANDIRRKALEDKIIEILSEGDKVPTSVIAEKLGKNQNYISDILLDMRREGIVGSQTREDRVIEKEHWLK